MKRGRDSRHVKLIEDRKMIDGLISLTEKALNDPRYLESLPPLPIEGVDYDEDKEEEENSGRYSRCEGCICKSCQY